MRYVKWKFVTPLLALVVVLLLIGTGCSSMKRGSMKAVTPVTTKERVGSVYLLRGWIGIFSTGIDSLGDKINAQGVNAQVFQESQWSKLADTIVAQYKDKPNHEPIVIVGHSYGADDAVLIARRLAEHKIKVDVIITLDPVTPKKVPSNVALAYNLYQTGKLDGLPFLRGIALTADEPGPATLRNMNIRKDRTDLLESGLDHFNIEKKKKVHDDVIVQVLKACPPRTQWTAARSTSSTIVAKTPVKPTAVAAAAPAKPPAATPVATPVVAKPTDVKTFSNVADKNDDDTKQ